MFIFDTEMQIFMKFTRCIILPVLGLYINLFKSVLHGPHSSIKRTVIKCNLYCNK